MSAESRMKLFVTILCCLSSALAEPQPDVLKTLANTGTDAVQAVSNPIEKTVVATTLKKCDAFKALFGVSFDQLKNNGNPDVTKLSIDFFTPNGKKIFNITEAAKGLLSTKEFDASRPTVMFLHGFFSSPLDDAAVTITDALLKKGGVNALALDSSSLIGFFYLKSSTCVQFIGEALAEVLIGLVQGGVDPKNVHIVGHSLGSHIAGFAGKNFQNATNQNIDRLTGLDPAGPCFFQERPDLRLKESDADFVDVIHSDAGVLGLVDPLGDVDFFPNDGDAQPGCAIPPCSHSRAWQLYGESILNEEAFPALKCSGWDTFKSGGCDNNRKANMGAGVDRGARGNYYLKTNGHSPYGLGKHAEKKEEKKEEKKKFWGLF